MSRPRACGADPGAGRVLDRPEPAGFVHTLAICPKVSRSTFRTRDKFRASFSDGFGHAACPPRPDHRQPAREDRGGRLLHRAAPHRDRDGLWQHRRSPVPRLHTPPTASSPATCWWSPRSTGSAATPRTWAPRRPDPAENGLAEAGHGWSVLDCGDGAHHISTITRPIV